MENETIANQIRQSMQQCEQQYSELTNQMQQLSDKFEELKQQREQVKGQYVAYNNMLITLQGGAKLNQPAGVTEHVEEQHIEAPEEVEEKTENVANVEAPEETQQETVVTDLSENVSVPEIKEDEEEQIKNIVKQVNKKQPKKEDIPDYLKDEYNK